MQVANVTNAALDKLRAAGVVMVPFDSTGLVNISATAWGGQVPKSSAYETSDTTSRCDLSSKPQALTHIQQPVRLCTLEPILVVELWPCLVHIIYFMFGLRCRLLTQQADQPGSG